jgi:hypothetical protein
MRRAIIVATVVLLVAISTAAEASLTPVKLIGGKGEQYWPSSNGTHVTWADYVDGRDTVWVMMLDGTDKTRLNEQGTEGGPGSFIAGTDKVLYQQFHRDRSDLYFYDVSARTRRKAPSAVSSSNWEYLPQASADYILFLRGIQRADGSVKKRKLMLYDRATGDQTILIGDIGGKSVFPGYAGSQFVAWTVCGSVTCTISYWDEQSATTAKLPTPEGKADYAPAFDETNSQVYFVRSAANRCGRHVTIRRAAIGDPVSVEVAAFPAGIDTGWTLALAPNPDSGQQDLYFERWNCDTQNGDVYVVPSADTV